MNKLKQKIFGYFNDNKVLSYITLVCFVLIFVFLILDEIHNLKINTLFKNSSNEEASIEMVKRTYMYLLQDIIVLLFIVCLVGVYFNFPRKLKLLILFFYVGIYVIYEAILTIYSIEIKHPLVYSHKFIWTIGCFLVIGINAILLLCLNNRHKNIFLIITFIVLNFLINMSSAWQTIYTHIKFHDFNLMRINLSLQSYYKIYFVFICIAAVVILLFIPIFKNQCPQCGFKNTKQAKFCGKCGHNLTEKVFSWPLKK